MAKTPVLGALHTPNPALERDAMVSVIATERSLTVATRSTADFAGTSVRVGRLSQSATLA